MRFLIFESFRFWLLNLNAVFDFQNKTDVDVISKSGFEKYEL